MLTRSLGLAEGSHIFKEGGYYYLLTAEAGTDIQHRAMIKRSTALFGAEWEQNPANPILFNGLASVSLTNVL